LYKKEGTKTRKTIGFRRKTCKKKIKTVSKAAQLGILRKTQAVSDQFLRRKRLNGQHRSQAILNINGGLKKIK
jgi:hypothetical protein